MKIQKSRRKNHVTEPSQAAFDHPRAFATLFTDQTRIMGVDFDLKRGELELEFDNGCFITLRSDGTWKIARS